MTLPLLRMLAGIQGMIAQAVAVLEQEYRVRIEPIHAVVVRIHPISSLRGRRGRNLSLPEGFDIDTAHVPGQGKEQQQVERAVHESLVRYRSVWSSTRKRSRSGYSRRSDGSADREHERCAIVGMTPSRSSPVSGAAWPPRHFDEAVDVLQAKPGLHGDALAQAP